MRNPITLVGDCSCPLGDRSLGLPGIAYTSREGTTACRSSDSGLETAIQKPTLSLETKHERRYEDQKHGSHSLSRRSWVPRVGA